MTAKVEYRIVDVGELANNATAARDLASLHTTMLGHSPLVLMGPEFMEKIYYSVLPREKLIGAALAYVDDRPAGFIVATGDPEEFMNKALRRHWIRIAWIMAKSVLLSPGRIFALREAYQIQSNVQEQEYGPEMGEMLSFGVLPDYRSRKFVRETAIHVGADLMSHAVQHLVRQGKSTIRAIVDKDNLEAKFFYRSQGWQVGLADVKGWSVPTMEFLYDCNNPIKPE